MDWQSWQSVNCHTSSWQKIDRQSWLSIDLQSWKSVDWQSWQIMAGSSGRVWTGRDGRVRTGRVCRVGQVWTGRAGRLQYGMAELTHVPHLWYTIDQIMAMLMVQIYVSSVLNMIEKTVVNPLFCIYHEVVGSDFLEWNKSVLSEFTWWQMEEQRQSADRSLRKVAETSVPALMSGNQWLHSRGG